MTPGELDAAVDHQLCDVLATVGEIPTKWVTVVEVVDADGKRWLRTLGSPDAATWDTIGMLGQALASEKANALSGYAQ